MFIHYKYLRYNKAFNLNLTKYRSQKNLQIKNHLRIQKVFQFTDLFNFFFLKNWIALMTHVMDPQKARSRFNMMPIANKLIHVFNYNWNFSLKPNIKAKKKFILCCRHFSLSNLMILVWVGNRDWQNFLEGR